MKACYIRPVAYRGYGDVGVNPLACPVDLTIAVCCLLYTSDAADERSSVDLGGRRIIKKKKSTKLRTD